MIFVGEYLNGKRSGKGKEFSFYGSLIFEGNYKNGKRNGIGKKYYNSKEYFRFVGEYLNGRKWNGKGYDENNNTIYELKDGKGYVKKKNIYGIKELYEGDYLNGEKHGKGKEYYSIVIEAIFEGEY